jgi:hypothetical protein
MGVVVVGKRVVDSAVRGVGSGFLEGGQRVMRQGGIDEHRTYRQQRGIDVEKSGLIGGRREGEEGR